MTDYTEYVPTKMPNQFIKFSISYNYDTYHWATGKTKEKGYQLVATPVEKGEMYESFTAFQGFYKIIHPCPRKSQKQLKIAIEKFHQDYEQYLNYFKERGYEM
jgi:hypothetical protein